MKTILVFLLVVGLVASQAEEEINMGSSMASFELESLEKVTLEEDRITLLCNGVAKIKVANSDLPEGYKGEIVMGRPAGAFKIKALSATLVFKREDEEWWKETVSAAKDLQSGKPIYGIIFGNPSSITIQDGYLEKIEGLGIIYPERFRKVFAHSEQVAPENLSERGCETSALFYVGIATMLASTLSAVFVGLKLRRGREAM